MTKIMVWDYDTSEDAFWSSVHSWRLSSRLYRTSLDTSKRFTMDFIKMVSAYNERPMLDRVIIFCFRG